MLATAIERMDAQPMTSGDWLIFALALLNLAGILFCVWKDVHRRRQWQTLLQERAALEIFLREECHDGIHFCHEGEMRHLDVYRTNHSSQTPHLDRRHGHERRNNTDDDIPLTVN